MNNIGEIELKKEPKIVWRKVEDIPVVYVRPAFITQINSLAWLEGK